MGATKNANESVFRLFEGSWKRIGHLECQGAVRPIHPVTWQSDFREKKEKNNEAYTCIAGILYALHDLVFVFSLSLALSFR